MGNNLLDYRSSLALFGYEAKSESTSNFFQMQKLGCIF